MDVTTTTVIVCMHLLASGALLLLISRRATDREGLGWFGAGCVVFGAAYACRLALDQEAPALEIACADAAVVLGAVIFHGGLARFGTRSEIPFTRLAMVSVGYLLASLLAMSCAGPTGRYALFNAVLGSIQLGFGGLALRMLACRRNASLRMPLLSIGGLMTAAGLATLLRAAFMVSWGLEPLMLGWPAEIYTSASSLMAVLLGPLVVWLVFARLTARLAKRHARPADSAVEPGRIGRDAAATLRRPREVGAERASDRH